MRVYEIAKEYDLDTKDILNFLQSIGVSKTAVAMVDRETLGRILSHYGLSSPGADPGIGPSPHTLSDHWTLYDTLGYEPYAYSIYRFLVHEQSQPPLTVSIQAPWGGGKTSMMRMIQSHLDPYSVEDESLRRMTEKEERGSTVGSVLRTVAGKKTPIQDILADDESLSRFVTEIMELFRGVWDYFSSPLLAPHNDVVTESFRLLEEHKKQEEIRAVEKSKVTGNHRFSVWFNAWKYQSADHVWAGLLDAIVRQVCERMRPKQRERFLLELHLHRNSRDVLRKSILSKITAEFWQFGQWLTAGLAAGIVGFFAASSLDLTLVKSLMALWCLLDVAWMGLHFVFTFFRFRRKPACEHLREFIEPPDYRRDAARMDALDRDMRAVFTVLRNPRVWMHPDYQHYSLPLTVFVDDLDRCSPDNVAAVIEGINRFLAGDYPDAMFVLGMDAEMVAAALEQAHHSILSSLPGNPAETLIGWRFMDKFVQLPFDLPLPSEENLENYTRNLLGDPVAVESMKWAREAVWNFDTPIQKDVPSREIADRILEELADDGSGEISSEYIEQLLGPLKDGIEKQRKERAVLDEGIGRFSDGESDVQTMILQRAPQFSRNPREIKRFLNVFRFRYTLWWRRQKLDAPNVSIDQLVRWVEFSLKWPHVLRWLQRTTLSDRDGSDPREVGTRIAKGLAHLEEIAERKPSERAAKFRERFQTDPYRIPWINDDSLMTFFQSEAGLNKTDRLSACEGRGVF